MKAFKNWVLFAAAALFSVATFAQGVTNSSMGGKVTDDLGEPLPGANVVAVHVPSGTTYGAATDFDGFYRISNMRTGGPYTITISYVGFNDFSRNNIMLGLGQSERVSTQMVPSSTALEEVVVTGQVGGVFSSGKTGAETVINRRQIEALPQASRSIADFVRTTPQAQITEGDDGFSISLAGQNNRYNAIYIDGAVNNDVFGLAGSGTNGGQTGVSPFSVDAIESFTVQLAPYDVKISGFAGGAISAVTRSGTNEWEGSVYGFLRNESLAGKTPPSLVDESAGEEREKLDEFSSETYGFRVGGPIVKDKLFFFFNYERQDEETPQPFNFSNYTGDSNAQDITNLVNFIANEYGYDAGGFERSNRTLESDKITAKLDWNIDEKNKLSFSTRYVNAENLEARNSSPSFLGFVNGSELFASKTLSSSLEWSYQGDKVANSLIFGYTRQRDDRDPLGDPFPTIRINDGAGFIEIGAERFSTANLLDADVFTITNNFEIYKGAHTITIGTHNEFSSIKNLFFANNFGTYGYRSVQQFLDGDAASTYDHGYGVLSSAIGDDSPGAAEFDVAQFGFYFQDEVQISDDFRLTAGIRFDIPVWDDYAVNDDFNENAIPLLEAAGKDLQGARVGRGVSTIVHVAPRLGFNWDVNGDRTTQIRGGLGIFTSRLPFVWPGGVYNNNGGVTGGFSDERDFDDPIFFNPDVNDQPRHLDPESGDRGGNVDLFASGFKLPQRLKYSLAVDQQLPGGFVASAEGFYIDNITEVFYENLNIGEPEGTYAGADNRPFYNAFNRITSYNRVILASNTGAGYSWNTAFTLSKPFSQLTDQISVSGATTWSYGDGEAIFDGTSSQNSSQWRNIQTVNGKNRVGISRSDFSQGHRISSNFTFNFKWNDNFRTQLGFFHESVQGTPYSFTYGSSEREDAGFSRFGGNLLFDDTRDNALMYIPADASEIRLFDDNGNGSTDDEWETLNALIEESDYLRERRGQYAERNGDRGPWSHVIDLRFLQDFTIDAWGKKHTLQFTADIFNFTNLLNKDWGQRRFASQNVQILNVVSQPSDLGPGEAPVFLVNERGLENTDQLDDRGIQSSRWQMQFGLRYIFN